jgi:hypothetical protein
MKQDCLDDKAKSIIPGYTPSNPPSNVSSSSGTHFGKPPFGRPAFKPQAHLHDLSAYDFLLANMRDLEHHPHTNHDTPSDDVSDQTPEAEDSELPHQCCQI